MGSRKGRAIFGISPGLATPSAVLALVIPVYVLRLGSSKSVLLDPLL